MCYREKYRRKAKYVRCGQAKSREKPECTRYARCKGCPYPSHGFLCWSRDGNCLRSLMREKEGG